MKRKSQSIKGKQVKSIEEIKIAGSPWAENFFGRYYDLNPEQFQDFQSKWFVEQGDLSCVFMSDINAKILKDDLLKQIMLDGTFNGVKPFYQMVVVKALLSNYFDFLHTFNVIQQKNCDFLSLGKLICDFFFVFFFLQIGK